MSPSVHLWVPSLEEGLPIVEGIFDQRLQGEGEEFTGAAPTHLPEGWCERLARDAVRLARLFQELGYFGRCSFDAILIGDDLESAQLHWIECNGRWSGVSLPMTLANRIFGDWRRQPFVITEFSHLRGKPHPLADVIEAIRDDLFSVDGPARGAVVLSPSPLESGTGFELMVFDVDADSASARAQFLSAKLQALLRKDNMR